MSKTIDKIMKLEEKHRTAKTANEAFELVRKIAKLYMKIKPCPHCKGTGMVDKKKRGGK